ncbi:unnamed protein product [Closterium sp. Naga37s-1]|nr:unnamed protein product [Closterium sp. Naga37s-1]
MLRVESLYTNDHHPRHNALSLPPDMLARRTVETLDIAEGGREEGKTGREGGGGGGRDGPRADGLCVDGAIPGGCSSSGSSGSSGTGSGGSGGGGSGVSNHPSTFVSAKTGRGPFKSGWQVGGTCIQGGHSGRAFLALSQLNPLPPGAPSPTSLQAHTSPLMTAYKVVTVDVPYWGFGSRLEKYLAKVR